MAGIEATGLEETRQGLENVFASAAVGRVALRLSRRSQTIFAVHLSGTFVEDAVNEETIEDAKAAFKVLEGKVGDHRDPKGTREQVGRALGSVLRRMCIIAIDNRDLIDTGKFRADVQRAPTEIGASPEEGAPWER